jgi:xanthine dehydrogenase accessory factor
MTTILIKSGGDIATGIAHRLHVSGYRVVITELPEPTVIRRMVAFAAAVYEQECQVEGVTAKCVGLAEVEGCLADGVIPVLVDPEGRTLFHLRPDAMVDAILAKCNTGSALVDAPVVIGIGPGFEAGRDVHAVVETMRGHDLGRVITNGFALPNTGQPGEIGGYSLERLLRAPCDGVFATVRVIGDTVAAGEVVARVAGQPVVAQIGGVLRGMLFDGLTVKTGMKIGDIDPRCCKEHCFSISDKARAVGGGVLEALLRHDVLP